MKTWVAGEVLFAADLENEFNNPLNNALALISPLTGDLAAGGFDLTGLGELAFNDEGNASAVGRARRNGNSLTWHDRTGAVPLQVLIGGGIFGLNIANNATDATNDIDVTVGAAVDSTEAAVLRLTGALTKQLDAGWAVGTNAGMLDTGAIANTTYHLFVIQRVDTGVVDILASTSATAPTLPTSYTLFRIIGSIIRSGGTILAFTAVAAGSPVDGVYYQLSTAVLDVNATNPGTAAVTRTLTVPIGINVRVVMNVTLSSTGIFTSVRLVDLTVPDVATVSGSATMGQLATTSNTNGQVEVQTNTSGQIRSRNEGSDGGTVVQIATQGWYHYRGRDN